MQINNFVNKNMTKTVEDAIIVMNTDIIIQAIGYPTQYLYFDDIKYKGERVTEDTVLDVQALKLKEINKDEMDNDWANDADKLIVIPKGAKITLRFNEDDYDADEQTFSYVTLIYNGIEIRTNNNAELESMIDYISKM